MDRRLVLVDVQRGAGKQVMLERPRQRAFVDDRPARCVDQVRRPLHPRQGFLVDEMPGLCRQRYVQRKHVGGHEKPIQRHRLQAGDFDASPRRIGDAHAEGRRPPRDRLRDPPDPDEPELLATKLGAEQEIERPALPVTASRQPVTF